MIDKETATVMFMVNMLRYANERDNHREFIGKGYSPKMAAKIAALAAQQLAELNLLLACEDKPYKEPNSGTKHNRIDRVMDRVSSYMNKEEPEIHKNYLARVYKK